MTEYSNEGIGGVIVFNANGTATYFAKIDDKDVAKLRGPFAPEGTSVLSNGSDILTITRRDGKNNYRGFGTAVIAGTSYNVSAFKNGVNPDGTLKDPSKPSTLAIKPSDMPAQANCPW